METTVDEFSISNRCSPQAKDQTVRLNTPLKSSRRGVSKLHPTAVPPLGPRTIPVLPGSEGTLAAIRMEIAPLRLVAAAETSMAPSLMKSPMEAAEPAASPGRCRGRRKSGGAENGRRDESDADLAKHD